MFKNDKKVSFNIASEASYVYILSGQKFIKTAINVPFWRVFENLKLAVKQSYQAGQFYRTKIDGKYQNKYDILSNLLNNVQTSKESFCRICDNGHTKK